PDTLINSPDSSFQQNVPQANDQPRINFNTYFALLGNDAKLAITKPFHMSKQDWGRVGIFAAALGTLALADRPIQRYAVDLRTRSNGLQKVSKQVTRFGSIYGIYTIGALTVASFVSRDEKMQTTTLLATQSLIMTGALETVVKFLTGRQRPYFIDSTNVPPRPIFYGPFHKAPRDQNGKRTNTSFPSGHAALSFAVATVYAREYKNKPWVPVVAYSAAGLISLSRITENRHWATDLLAGAALGYLSGRLVTNNWHHYAYMKFRKKGNGTLRFNLQYNQGQIMPGLTYTFD
ncbi:MAG TPA: phosphatase PAP2 family protein, partial [Puia sp.]|nr:phosphatase PAP2 family protein [Puia sp.]